MESAEFPTTAKNGALQVPFERVVSMVRHLTHDARNGLNSVELQAAYVSELVVDEDAQAEVKQLRGMIASTAKLLQSLSSRFWVSSPQFVTYPAPLFLEDFRDRLNRTLPENAADIVWTENLQDRPVRVDIEMIFSGLSEFFKNAFDFREEKRSIAAHAETTADGRLAIELRESKTAVPSPADRWGIEPLVSTRRAGYGLGIFHARQILALHEAELTIKHDPAAALLTTRITFPVPGA